MEPRLPTSFSSEPNLVPMIDVLLVLLIIAMVTPGRLVLDAQPGAPPSTAGSPPARQAPPPVLRISGAGRFVLEGVHLSTEQLMPALRALAETRTPRVLLISADQELMFKEVVSAMDAAKGAGMDVVALESPEGGAMRRRQ